MPKHKKDCSCFECSIDVNAMEAKKKLNKMERPPKVIEDYICKSNLKKLYLLKERVEKEIEWAEEVIKIKVND